MSPDEKALLAAVRANPADDLPRLVYADWLDEHGRGAWAAFIRLQCRIAAGGYDAATGRQLFDLEREMWGSWPDEGDMRSEFHRMMSPPVDWWILPESHAGGVPGSGLIVRRGFGWAIGGDFRTLWSYLPTVVPTQPIGLVVVKDAENLIYRCPNRGWMVRDEIRDMIGQEPFQFGSFPSAKNILGVDLLANALRRAESAKPLLSSGQALSHLPQTPHGWLV